MKTIGLSGPAATLQGMASQYVDYESPFDRPDVEVCVDGQWWPGEISAQRQDDDGQWTARVQYYGPDGRTGAWFPTSEIRRDTIDRSYGRH